MRCGMLPVLSVLLGLVAADVYMHNPRGSNNRLNEKSANRNNGNRLFDSQNNNRGGYNVGDRTNAAFANENGADYADAPFNKELSNGQYSMMYFEESELHMEWTAQHGAGGSEKDDPHKLNSNIVIQYACNTDPSKVTNANAHDKAIAVELKDGRNTNTPGATNDFNNVDQQKNNNDNNDNGRHENEMWYYECQTRKRNKGLFVADQKLKGNAAKYTRQNPNGNRRGLECPEERDYYPYWNPSPWVDIAVHTDNMDDCTLYKNESQNVKDKCRCVPNAADNAADRTAAFNAFTKEECDENDKLTWACTKWGVDPPQCVQAAWSRVNHLGNVKGSIEPASHKWTVPKLNTMPAFIDKKTNTIAKCVVRLRYNISTDDYNPRTTDAKFNENVNKNIISPVEQNPTVDVGASLQGLRLAINTAQFGRTFQDRSHSFYIKKKDTNLASCGKIKNLEVRGKRGNIVQTFPSVEYDFIPGKLETTSADCVHVQWTGSNTHNNGNPAGDGQAGDAGEGTGGTDRHNMVAIHERGVNYPIAYDQTTHDQTNLFKNLEHCYNFQTTGTYMNAGIEGDKAADDCTAMMASAGYYQTKAEIETKTPTLNVLLNNAHASFTGAVLQVKKTGTYHYMCTRNNNFSNRSQKGTIKVN